MEYKESILQFVASKLVRTPWSSPYEVRMLFLKNYFPAFFLLSLFLFFPALPWAAEPVESVRIGGQDYPVPEPWAGNRLKEPRLVYEDFKKVPDEFSKNNSNIYVLKEIYPNLLALLQAAKEDGIILKIASGYRSSSYQRKIYLRMFEEGREFADIVRYVAPPGYSEHMLGIAVDFAPSNWRFAKTKDYAWLKAHAMDFGFAETYPRFSKKKMAWEAWHWCCITCLTQQISPAMRQEPQGP